MERARILILTASIGSGHTRAAEAICAALTAHPHAKDMQVDVVDFMTREVSVIHYLMKRIYLTMLRFVPDLYDVFFRVAGKNTSGGIVRNTFAWVMGGSALACAERRVVCSCCAPDGLCSA